MKRYILAIDEGTTSERVVLYDTVSHKIIASHGLKLTQYYPKNSYVEHDANEIWNNVYTSLCTVIMNNKLKLEDIFGIGITNQRETTVAWNKKTGKPIHKAIVWQCKRTATECDKMPQKMRNIIKRKTGLVVDSYFSATKMKWILNNVTEAQKLLKTDNLALGTIDSFLVYKLTGGKVFATDTTNASRTMLVDISKPFEYDKELLEYFGVPENTLPQILNSADNFGYAKTPIGDIPILSVIGDQQSSMVGQACFKKGAAKMTYGTGGFLLVNSGKELPEDNRLAINTVGYSINGKTTYAIEGSIFNVGSSLEYLKETLNLFSSYSELDGICKNANSENLHVLPAFSGLGAPYWDQNARGAIYGLTLGTTKGDIVKSCIESFAYLVSDVAEYLKTIGVNIKSVNADGGVSKSSYLLSLQADLLQAPVYKMEEAESTSLGTIFLTALKSGAIASLSDISNIVKASKTFEPNITKKANRTLIDKWHTFVTNVTR